MERKRGANPWADVQESDTRRSRVRASGRETAKPSWSRRSGVNPAVVWRRMAFLPGEILPSARKGDAWTGVPPRRSKKSAEVVVGAAVKWRRRTKRRGERNDDDSQR